VGCRRGLVGIYTVIIEPFNAELNPIRHLLALLETRHILHVSRIRIKVVFIFKNSAKETEVNHEKPQNSWVLSYNSVLF